MRAGKGSSDLYLAEWRRESEEVDPAGIASQVARRAAELEARFPPDYLESVVKAGGLIANIRPPRQAAASTGAAT
jgi:hypothetical protein